MIEKMQNFLARAPALSGVTLKWGQTGPRPNTGGIHLQGVKVLDRKADLLGRVKQRCRAEFVLRLCLPFPVGDGSTALDNAARLAELQAWVSAESEAGRAPRFGNCDAETEQTRTDGGQLDRLDVGGTGVYSIRVLSDYTMLYQA